MATKPVVNINNAYIEGNLLYGYPENYPEEHCYYPGAVTNTKLIHTSPIVRKEEDYVETERTIYFVKSWRTL